MDDCMKAKKKKVAAKSQKQIRSENVSTLFFYFSVIGIVNVIYYVLQFLFFWESFTAKFIIFSIICLILNGGSYKFMQYMATPRYHPTTGALLDAGNDLNCENGTADHIKDILLVTCIVQSLSLISNYFWILLLLIPGRAFHLLWVNVLGPWFFAQPEDNVDTAQQAKKQRKHDLKVARAQNRR